MQFCIQDMKRPENTFCLHSLGKARKKQRTKTQMPPASARNTVTPKQQGLVCCGLRPTAASDAQGEALLIQGQGPQQHKEERPQTGCFNTLAGASI